MMEPMKAWFINKIWDVEEIIYRTKMVRLVYNRDLSTWTQFGLVKFIRPTPFKDINGDLERLLWEGDIVETIYFDGKESGVIFFNKLAGQWGVQQQKYNGLLSGLLPCDQRHFWSRWVGNVFENPELVPWWKGEES